MCDDYLKTDKHKEAKKPIMDKYTREYLSRSMVGSPKDYTDRVKLKEKQAEAKKNVRRGTILGSRRSTLSGFNLFSHN